MTLPVTTIDPETGHATCVKCEASFPCLPEDPPQSCPGSFTHTACPAADGEDVQHAVDEGQVKVFYAKAGKTYPAPNPHDQLAAASAPPAAAPAAPIAPPAANPATPNARPAQ